MSKSNLEITDIKVGDVVLTTAPIHYYNHGPAIIGAGKFIRIKKIVSNYSARQAYKYHLVYIESNETKAKFNIVAWDQLKNKIITKNKEWKPFKD